MHIPKKIAIGVATAAVGGTALFGGTAAFAQSDTAGGSTLVDKIATTFHLNKDDVQKVFDESRSEMEANREARWEERLTQAVTDGKLTEAQEQLITDKHNELKTTFNEIRDSSDDPAVRHEKMKALRDELKQWAQDNNIPLRWLGGGFGPGGSEPRGDMQTPADAEPQDVQQS